MQSSSVPSNFLRRVVIPAPRSDNPPIGSQIAKKTLLDRRLTDAVVGATVVTVKIELPEPVEIEPRLNEQIGGRLTAGVTAQVRLTVLLKPFTGAMVIVEVAALPATIDAGESGEAVIVKSASGAAVTVS